MSFFRCGDWCGLDLGGMLIGTVVGYAGANRSRGSIEQHELDDRHGE